MGTISIFISLYKIRNNIFRKLGVLFVSWPAEGKLNYFRLQCFILGKVLGYTDFFHFTPHLKVNDGQST